MSLSIVIMIVCSSFLSVEHILLHGQLALLVIGARAGVADREGQLARRMTKRAGRACAIWSSTWLYFTNA